MCGNLVSVRGSHDCGRTITTADNEEQPSLSLLSIVKLSLVLRITSPSRKFRRYIRRTIKLQWLWSFRILCGRFPKNYWHPFLRKQWEKSRSYVSLASPPGKYLSLSTYNSIEKKQFDLNITSFVCILSITYCIYIERIIIYVPYVVYVHSARKEITATASPVLPDGYKDDRFLSRCFYCRPEASHYSSYWLYSILRLSFFVVGYKFTCIIPVIGYVPARKLKVETDLAAVSNTWNYLRKIQVQCRVIDFHSLFLAP